MSLDILVESPVLACSHREHGVDIQSGAGLFRGHVATVLFCALPPPAPASMDVSFSQAFPSTHVKFAFPDTLLRCLSFFSFSCNMFSPYIYKGV